jgi:hypothetical protein
MIATPIGGGAPIVLELPLDKDGKKQAYEPYYQLYSRLTYSHYRGEHGLSEQELAEILADDSKRVLRIVQTLTVGRTRKYWNINDLVVGDNILVIESGTVSKSFEISIAESDFKLEPVTDQLELYLYHYNSLHDKVSHIYKLRQQ